MSAHRPSDTVERRSFLSRLTAGAGAFAAGFALGPPASAQAARPQEAWRPTRHAQDDWFEEIPGKHRFFFDATSADGAGEAMAFATNYYVANRTGYGLADEDLAVVICLRHFATVFAFNDAMWAKYGESLSQRVSWVDPVTRGGSTVNRYNDGSSEEGMTNRGIKLDQLVARGTHFAVCGMATTVFAGVAARETGQSADAVRAELAANTIENAHIVPAGIVAVDRAQERGYSIQYIG
jgi:intracellular sulfur oxidation DsrE/DsrF family protein